MSGNFRAKEVLNIGLSETNSTLCARHGRLHFPPEETVLSTRFDWRAGKSSEIYIVYELSVRPVWS